MKKLELKGLQMLSKDQMKKITGGLATWYIQCDCNIHGFYYDSYPFVLEVYTAWCTDDPTGNIESAMTAWCAQESGYDGSQPNWTCSDSPYCQETIS